MTNAEKYENAIMREHDRFKNSNFDGFNPDYRKGLGNKQSLMYAVYCETHPNVTQEDRKKAYQDIHTELVKEYPSVRELTI